MSFDKSLALVLDLEGGFTYSHRNSDAGGSTYAGITQATYDRYCVYLNKPTKTVNLLSETEVTEFYRMMFWNDPQVNGKPLVNLLPEPLDGVFMQLSVNLGPGKAVKLLQACLLVKPDGILGPVSQAVLKAMDEVGSVSQDLLIAQLGHYVDVEQDWDETGLYNRVMRTKEWSDKQSALDSGSSD